MPAETEYYETLEISDTADEQDIRRAYKRLALKYHPDRNDGDLKAADQFKRVGEAYEVLNDPEKRSIYDAHGKSGLYAGSDCDGGFQFHNAEDIFSMFFGGEDVFRRKDRRNRRPVEIVHEIRVALEELYCGVTKQVILKRNRLCTSCEGSGVRDPNKLRKCNGCNGAGRVFIVQKGAGYIERTEHACHRCDGQGKRVAKDDFCRACNGKGLERQKHEITVEIEKGMHEDDHIRITGEGHQTHECRHFGDIVIVFALQRHPIFTRRGDCLIVSKRISLLDALKGTPVELTHLDNRKLRLIVSPDERETFDANFVWSVEGEGMPIRSTFGKSKGDLLMHFIVVMPSQLISPSVFTENPVLKKELNLDWRYVQNVSSASKRKAFDRNDTGLYKVITKSARK